MQFEVSPCPDSWGKCTETEAVKTDCGHCTVHDPGSNSTVPPKCNRLYTVANYGLKSTEPTKCSRMCTLPGDGLEDSTGWLILLATPKCARI